MEMEMEMKMEMVLVIDKKTTTFLSFSSLFFFSFLLGREGIAAHFVGDRSSVPR